MSLAWFSKCCPGLTPASLTTRSEQCLSWMMHAANSSPTPPPTHNPMGFCSISKGRVLPMRTISLADRSLLDVLSTADISGKKPDRIRPSSQRLPILHLILGGRSESLQRKLVFAYSKGAKVVEITVGADFCCPDQVLLTKKFHLRPGCG